MHMTILTCRNHPNLRWTCKEIAFQNGYNGLRNLFYHGQATGELSSDGHPRCETVAECSCSAKELMLAPEDANAKQLYEKWVAGR